MPKKMPVYIQMHNQMREWINTGEWKEGEKVPSERDLALQFDVSRMTARQAVNTLVDEGLLERRRGSGTFVALEKVREKNAIILLSVLQIGRESPAGNAFGKMN